MHSPLAKSHEIYKAHDLDLQQAISWHLLYGFVVSSSDFFGIGYFCNRDDTSQATQKDSGDTLFCTMCSGNMKAAMKPFLGEFEYLAFQRSFKNSDKIRVYPMVDFYSKLN